MQIIKEFLFWWMLIYEILVVTIKPIRDAEISFLNSLNREQKSRRDNMQYYKNIHTREKVYEPDWSLYVMEQLGIKVIPNGKNGELTLEQIEFIDEFTEWYFSGNWIKEEEADD